MPYKEFRDWVVYYRLRPWGDDWEQFAALISLVSKAILKDPIHPDDIIPHRNDDGLTARERWLKQAKKDLDELKRKQGRK